MSPKMVVKEDAVLGNLRGGPEQAGRPVAGADGAAQRLPRRPLPGSEPLGGPGCLGPSLQLPCCPQVYKGYVDDPRNTDNAWIETVAISVHFQDQNDVELKRLNSVRGWASGGGIRARVRLDVPQGF